MGTSLSYRFGLSAEETIALHYRAQGGEIRASRWRCREGELDLVVEFTDTIVFVEVKARAVYGAEAVTARQWLRIAAAATRYLAEKTDGTRPCRFDLAIVDRAGRLHRIENARSFDDW